MILLIDNYDSFSYNLYQMIGAIEPAIEVVRNDAVTVDEVARAGYSAIVLSPGPGRPADAGVCEEVVRRLAPSVPILGVCLGHQAICEAFGGKIGYARRLMHGKASRIEVSGDCALFEGLPAPFPVARYHSLAAREESLPECLRVCARAEDGEVMAVEHVRYRTFGVQFHPESVMTPDGERMLRNFMNIARREGASRGNEK